MDVNGNENCLQGLQCPKCGEHERLYIWVTTRATMLDDGTEETANNEYDEDSQAQCPTCDHCAKVYFFSLVTSTPLASEIVVFTPRERCRIQQVITFTEGVGWQVTVSDRQEPVFVVKDFDASTPEQTIWKFVELEKERA